MTIPDLRVAFVSCDLHLGGTSTFIVNLGGELTRRGAACRVYSFSAANPYGGDFKERGIPVHTEEARERIFEDRLHSILAELAEFQPHVVIANLGSLSYEVLRYVPEGVLRVGMVQADHEGPYGTIARYGQWVDLAVGVSEHICGKLRAIPSLAEAQIAYQPYGVIFGAEEWTPAPEPDAPIRILYLGRLDDEQKRAALLADLYDYLKEAGVPARWTLVGDGTARTLLESRMPSVPGAETRFTGTLPADEVPGIIPGHDVSVLVSLFEGLPLSLLETMGSGIVPIVSDIPSGVKQVVDRDTGFIIDPSDIPAYAKAVEYLHHHRDELAEKSRNSREKVRRDFSVTAMTDRWIASLESAMSCQPLMPWPRDFDIAPHLEAPEGITQSKWLRRLGKRLRALS